MLWGAYKTRVLCNVWLNGHRRVHVLQYHEDSFLPSEHVKKKGWIEICMSDGLIPVEYIVMAIKWFSKPS